MAAVDNKDESVDDFLQRIRELGATRDREDEERAKKLEEEILAGKQARQARRAERARSLSPDKDTPPVTPKAIGNKSLVDSPALTPSTRREPLLPLAREDSVNEALSKLSGRPLSFEDKPETISSGREESSTTISESSNPTTPATSTTDAFTPPVRLSWQRRPAQRRERPVTMYSTRSSMQEEVHAETREEDSSPSRSDILKNLGSKNADYFKQTDDRIQSNILRQGAYKEETYGEDVGGGKVALLGLGDLGKNFAVEASELSQTEDSFANVSGAGERDLQENTTLNKLDSAALSSLDESYNSSSAGLRGRASSVHSVGSNSHGLSDIVLSPGQGYTSSRLSPERRGRTPSPTKGLGGFVQSAMLKREGSINKRWTNSAGSQPGIVRNGSTSSPSNTRPQSLYGRLPALEKSSSALTEPEDENPLEEESAVDLSSPSLRPDSRQDLHTRSNSISNYNHTRKYSHTRTPSTIHDPPSGTDPSSPPVSPSKTYDQKRWSPTKSSWLESALKKTNDPVLKPAFVAPKPPSPERKPAAYEISFVNPRTVDGHRPIVPPKSGAFVPNPVLSPPPAFSHDKRRSESPEQRIGPGLGRARSRSEVTPGTLVSGKREDFLLKKEEPLLEKKQEKETFIKEEQVDGSEMPPAASETTSVEKPPVADKPLNRFPSTTSTINKPPIAPKPSTSGPHDFRANLKPRQNSTSGGGNNTPEFLQAMNRLRPSRTQNFVAEDKLKETILSGKAALTQTGGPEPRKRIDPLKESILEAKSAMKEKSGGKPVPRNLERKDSKVTGPPPPSVVQRMNLGRQRAGTETGSGSESDSSKIGVGKFTLRPRAGTGAASPAPSETPSESPSIGRLNIRARAQTTTTPSPPPQAKTPERNSSPPRKNFGSPDEARKNLGKNSPPPAPKPEPVIRPISKPALPSLKDRMNPNLAALLSRGPPGKAPGSSSSSGGVSTGGDGAEEEGKKKELTHLTKGRARGPKRRGPQKAAAAGKGEEKVVSPVKVESPAKPAVSSPVEEKVVKPFSPVKPAVSTPVEEKKEFKPFSPVKPAAFVASPVREEVKAFSPVKPAVSTPVEEKKDEFKPLSPSGSFKPQPSPKPESPAPSPAATEDAFKSILSSSLSKKPSFGPRDLPSPPVESQAATRFPSPLSPPKSIGAIALPGMISSPTEKSPRPDTPPKKASLSARSSIADLQLKPSSPLAESPTALRSASSISSFESRLSPGLGMGSPVQMLAKKTSFSYISEKSTPPPTPRKSSLNALSPGSPGMPPQTPPKPAAINKPLPSPLTDRALPATPSKPGNFTPSLSPALPQTPMRPASPLLSQPATPIPPTRNARTVNFSVDCITSDGKKTSLPAHQQHIFHDESMYLCTHVFTLPGKDKEEIEVFLWVGREVPQAHAEDVMVFARGYCRQVSSTGKLIQIKQSNEPLAFLQSLGSLLLLLRGRSPPPSILLPFMLRAEHVEGAVVFHEVDISRKELGSEWPFLVSDGKKVWIWKGRESRVRDVGVARLVAYDIGGGADVEEVEEGSEPRGFWEVVA